MHHDPIHGYPVLNLYTPEVRESRQEDVYETSSPSMDYVNYIEATLPVVYVGQVNNGTDDTN